MSETDLVAFVTARADEREAAAKAAADGDSGEWFMGDKWNVFRVENELAGFGGHEGHEENKLVCWGNVKSQSEHIEIHDPARSLRDVAATRAILAEHAKAARAYDAARDAHARNLSSLDRAETQLASDVALDKLMVWTQVLRILAAADSTDPDYDPSWAVS